MDPACISNGRTHASSNGGHFRVLIFGSKKKGNPVASVRILQCSAATGRAIGAPVKPADARQRKPDEGDQNKGVMRQKRAAGDADSGGGDESAKGRGWSRQQRG